MTRGLLQPLGLVRDVALEWVVVAGLEHCRFEPAARR